MSTDLFVRELNPDLARFEFRSEDESDGLSLSGWITRFGEETEITDQAGHYLESIKFGAFTRTITERGPAKVKMMYNHGKPGNNAIGDIPIGVWTRLEERREGLWGEGRILDAWHTIPVRAAIEAGAIDGMSFAFRVIGEKWLPPTRTGGLDRRQLTEVALHEAGVVNYQAYPGTSVSLRSAVDMYRRSAFQTHVVTVASDVATLSETREAVAPVGDTDPSRAEADPPEGITWRELHRMVLSPNRRSPDEPDRGAA